MNNSFDLKIQLINATFDEIDGIINEISEMSDKQYYVEIAVPALYSQLEKMAWLRYRALKYGPGKRFKDLILTYSNIAEKLKEIDLAFLYKWDLSEHKETDEYKKIFKNNHNQIKQALVDLYGEPNEDMENRFVNEAALNQALLKKSFCPQCIRNLNLFNRCEILYRFGRCKTVHEGYPHFNDISPDFLIPLAKTISNNMKNICLKEKKMPSEL